MNDDRVNHPIHYQTKTGLETIDVIEAFTEDMEGMEAVCTANVLKYICRWKKKNGLEDLKKAAWYLTRLINHVDDTVPYTILLLVLSNKDKTKEYEKENN